MLRKCCLPIFIQLVYGFSLFGQVTNIQARHDANNEKYIITYDLAKTKGQHYFNIELTAMIGDEEVRPSIVALTGDVGWHIKYGRKQQIVWDYFIDLEKLVGEITFKVRARHATLPAPPKPKLDIALGSAISGIGLYTLTTGGHTVLKRGQINSSAASQEDPIRYYYTFCATNSPFYMPDIARVRTADDRLICDIHFDNANQAYKKGIRKTAIGLAVLTGGIYTLLKKPFHQKKLEAYQKDNNLTLTPTFDWGDQIATPNGIVGVNLTYQFGR